MSKINKALTRSDYELRNNLPHLFGLPHYKWSRKFFECRTKYSFLVAANQIGKSSSQIRRIIHWATAKPLWPHLWKTPPKTFFYLYPSKPVATSEFHDKWVPEFLPRGSMKDDPQFGWNAEFKSKEIWAIRFNSGVNLYFRSYEQDSINLQTATCHYIASDEEMPEGLFQEIRSRIVATNGYFSMVFTATLGEEIWRRTMEPSNESEELFKDALKLNVSMYDCLEYEDGSPSPWTTERIRQVEAECGSEAEILKRVHGRFIVSSGVKYVSFDRTKNVCQKHTIPRDWLVFSGVDIGSGGEKNHPSAITFIAVQPDYKKGIVFQGWRGDGVITTSVDVLEKHQSMINYEGRQLHPVLTSFDWAAADFGNIASRAGVGVTPAKKKRDFGENLINSLFKTGMLSIMGDDPELSKLIVELSSLLSATSKVRAKDDFVDSLRYCASSIPWNFDGKELNLTKEVEKTTDEDIEPETEAERCWRLRIRSPAREEEAGSSIEEDFEFWQGQLD